MAVAKKYTGDIINVAQSQVGTGILEQLFRHSEVTCSDVIGEFCPQEGASFEIPVPK